MTQPHDAFLSYSHDDRPIAERISRRLRTYRPPRASGLTRRLRIFRDVERLTAAASLHDALVEQITQADQLVLLASPSATSTYINLEVDSFLAQKPAGRLHIVLLRGELEESLPARLRNQPEEPLFIDLRDADRKRFRLETLRLLAALYGVEYEKLRRQDEARLRRRRSLTAAALISTVFLVASGFLIARTPAEAWRLIRQPVTRTWSNALMPVEAVAVRRNDPETVVWFGRNARHASYLDTEGTSWTLTIFDGLSTVQRFSDRARNAPVASLGKPLLALTLTAQDGGRNRDTLVTLNARLLALVDTEDPLFAVRTDLRLADGSQETIPLTEVTPETWLRSLEPEPAGALRRRGVAGRDLQGQWTDYTNRDEIVEALFVGDLTDEAREVLDATASAEFVLFSNDTTLNATLKERLENENGDDLWFADFIDNDAWMTPTEPLTSTQDFARDEIEAPPDTTAEAGDKPISAALLQSLGDALPGADYYGITTLTRPGLALTTVRPFRDHHEIIQQPAPLHLLKVGEHPWRLVHLPTDVARIEIADVVQAEGAPSLLVCVTKQAGLFRSRDAGRTWHQANFDEATLEKGAEIKLIVAPGPTVYALVVLYREPGDDLNPLYRLERRTWIVRWRLGLAALLQPDAG